jgi:glycosyltransferase involved in cell wall biosynthesis
MSQEPVTPSVSVVIPTFNRRDLLTPVLAPLLAESDALEIIVVVDGAQDGSWELLAEMAENHARLLALRIENSGMGRARMAGARRAAGEIVLLLDDDVLVARGTVRGHARAHAGADHLVVVGAMPVAGGPQLDAADYPRVMYANEYRRHTERWLTHPELVLRTLWAGHLSLRRADLLALEPSSPAELGRGYHSDIDFGLRCLHAGLRGVYDPSLRAAHLYRRGPEAFLRDARNSGRSLRLLHESHASELGPYTTGELLNSVPGAARPVVALSRTRVWPARVAGLAVTGLGRLRLYRLQRGAAYVRKWMEQVRELPAVANPAGSGGSGR